MPRGFLEHVEEVDPEFGRLGLEFEEARPGEGPAAAGLVRRQSHDAASAAGQDAQVRADEGGKLLHEPGDPVGVRLFEPDRGAVERQDRGLLELPAHLLADEEPVLLLVEVEVETSDDSLKSAASISPAYQALATGKSKRISHHIGLIPGEIPSLDFCPLSGRELPRRTFGAGRPFIVFAFFMWAIDHPVRHHHSAHTVSVKEFHYLIDGCNVLATSPSSETHFCITDGSAFSLDDRCNHL